MARTQKPLTDAQRARKRQREKERVQANKNYIFSEWGTAPLEYEGKEYTISTLAKKSRSFIAQAISAQREENRLIVGKNYLGVAWANYESDFEFEQLFDIALSTPMQTLQQLIFQRLAQAYKKPWGGSNDMLGFALVGTFRTRKQGLEWFEDCETRGYGASINAKGQFLSLHNLQDSDIVRICLAKRFTFHRFLAMFYVVCSAVKNLHAIQFFGEISEYLEDNTDHPDIYNALFPFESELRVIARSRSMF